MQPLVVNRLTMLALALLAWATACRLGPPPRSAALQVGRVDVPAPEPGLADALARGLGAGLARRGGLGGGDAVQLRVLEARDAVEAVVGAGRVHRVQLVVEALVPGPRPRRLVWEGGRSYESSGADPLAAAAARARAFDRLAARAGDEIAAWALVLPPQPEP
jgi:hypothetical protein